MQNKMQRLIDKKLELSDIESKEIFQLLNNVEALEKLLDEQRQYITQESEKKPDEKNQAKIDKISQTLDQENLTIEQLNQIIDELRPLVKSKKTKEHTLPLIKKLKDIIKKQGLCIALSKKQSIIVKPYNSRDEKDDEIHCTVLLSKIKNYFPGSDLTWNSIRHFLENKEFIVVEEPKDNEMLKAILEDIKKVQDVNDANTIISRIKKFLSTPGNGGSFSILENILGDLQNKIIDLNLHLKILDKDNPTIVRINKIRDPLYLQDVYFFKAGSYKYAEDGQDGFIGTALSILIIKYHFEVIDKLPEQ